MNMGLAFILLIVGMIMNGMLMSDTNFYIQFIYDLNPYGQIAQLTAMNCFDMLRCIIMDIICFTLFSIVGINYFNEKDIIN